MLEEDMFQHILANSPEQLYSLQRKYAKNISLLNYTIQITEALADEWLKNYAAGLSGTGDTSDIGDSSE
jgi:hypothetical protein